MVADFKKKQKPEFSKNKIAFQVAGILFLIIIVILIVSDIRIYQRKRELMLQIDNYKKQIENIKKSSQNLKDAIANSNNPDYIEKIAYEQLGEQKPGEKEVIFTAPPKKPSETAKSDNSWTSWMSQSWNWIKSKF